MEWMFWKRSRCPLCDYSFKGGSDIWLKHTDGMSKLNICDKCAEVLESSKTLKNESKFDIHEPPEEI